MRTSAADILISPHALTRWRERFDAEGTEAEMRAALEIAYPAPNWARVAYAKAEGKQMWVSGSAVFVLAPRPRIGARDGPPLVLLTVLRLEWLAGTGEE